MENLDLRFMSPEHVIDYAVGLALKELQLPEDVTEVRYDEGKNFPNPKVLSLVTHDDMIIWFNKDMVDKVPPELLFITAAHEVRHVYQLMLVNFCLPLEPQSVVDRWTKEFSGDHQYTYDEENDPEYFEEWTELDAIAFSTYVGMKYIEKKPVIPKEYDYDIKKRVKEMIKKYNK